MSTDISSKLKDISGGRYIRVSGMNNGRIPKEDLADYVKRARHENGLSQRDVEAKSSGGISKGYIGQIENREVLGLSVTPQKLRALAKGLGVSEDEIFAVARGKSLDQNGFRESEFALMYEDVQKLTPQQKRDFKIAWEMAKDALRRIKEDGQE
jgi:transcriptional regulator with XRE-family HTH domain